MSGALGGPVRAGQAARATVRGVLAAALALGLAGGARAQVAGRGDVAGTVVSRSTAEPISGAEVEVLGAGMTGVTVGDGSFRLEGLEAGEHRVRVSYLGFETEVLRIRVRPGFVTELDVELGLEPIDLPALEVEATQRHRRGKLAGFYERRNRRGNGEFLTREEIEKAPGDDLRHVFRRVTGLEVQRCAGRYPPPGCYVLSGRGCSSISDVTYYVDGARLPVTVSGTGPGVTGGLGQLSSSDVEAIEVYTGPGGVPSRFGGVAGGCVVAIWTRTGAAGPGG